MPTINYKIKIEFDIILFIFQTFIVLSSSIIKI